MTATAEPIAALPEYAEELFARHRYKVLYGGRGAAKSWSVARALLIRASSQTTRILCTRELQTSIKDSVHQLLKDQIEALGLPGFLVTDREIRHVNGTLFLFEGLRYNVTKIKSLEGIDIVWVEEGERISAESWQVLIPTIRKAGSEIWVTFNPDRAEDATYQRLVVKPPPDAWVQKVSADDNPWLTDELRAERAYLYRVDPDAAAHVWGGEVREISDAQILEGKWVVEDFTPVRDHAAQDECDDLAAGRACSHGWDGPYQGMDFGFSIDPTTVVRCWVHARVLYLEHELYRVGLELDDTATKAKTAVPGVEHYAIRADNARPESISYLRRFGLPKIVGVKKWKGSVEDGIAHLRQYERIVIHGRCRNAAAEARTYSYKVDERSGGVLPDIVDAHNHIWDAVRYALAPLIQVKPKLTVWTAGRLAAAAKADADAKTAHAQADTE